MHETYPPGIVDPALRDALLKLRPDASGRILEGARWGMLVEPPGDPAGPSDDPACFRLALFGSFWIGHAALRGALAYQGRGPAAARVVGMATDDPITPAARISRRKRAWWLMTEAERMEVELALAGRALGAGIPLYTGEIKTPGFRRLLAEWRPHAIITCGFGQVLDRAILEAVPYGAYNCHPTDLAGGHGAGPAPWDDMTARGVHHTVWSVHQMTEVVDEGPVIGQTPPINVADAEGRLPTDHRSFFYKVLPPIGWMVLRLVDALVRRREAGLRGPLARIDFVEGMPVGLRRQLAQPLARDWLKTPIPEPGADEFAALRHDVPEAAEAG